MKGWRWLGFVLAASVGAVVMAQAPATQPVGPRLAVVHFFTAIEQGKPEQIPPVCMADDADSKRLAEDFKGVAAAMATLRKSAAARFGAEAADVVQPRVASPDDDFSEKVTGDKAEVRDADYGSRIALVRIDGQWKIDMVGSIQNELPDDGHAYLTGLSEAIERTARDIDAGKFASADLARQALQARQEGLADAGPATKPSSRASR